MRAQRQTRQAVLDGKSYALWRDREGRPATIDDAWPHRPSPMSKGFVRPRLIKSWSVPLHVALDNFSENEHVPWVHQMLGWNEAGAQHVQLDAESYDDRTVVQYPVRGLHVFRCPLLGVANGDTFHNDWVMTFDPVQTIYTLSCV